MDADHPSTGVILPRRITLKENYGVWLDYDEGEFGNTEHGQGANYATNSFSVATDDAEIEVKITVTSQ